MLPSQAIATAWITMFKNRKVSGPLGMLEAFGIYPPDWLAYGPLPISICMALSYFPFAFLLFSNALNKIDIQLEEVATSLGAKTLTVWSKIIIPLLIPTTMSVLLLTVARTLGTFATPYILGTPAKYTLLSTSLYSSVRSNESGVVAVIAIVLSCIGIILLLVDISVVKKWQRFVTVGGKGIKRPPSKLGVFQIPTTIFAWIIFLIAAFGPFLVLALSTLMREPGNFALSNFDLAYWTGVNVPGMDQPGIFTSPEIIIALRNSFLIAGSAAIICGILGLIVGYAVVRLPGSLISAYLRQISFLPYLMPGLAFAAAFLSLFAVSRGTYSGFIWFFKLINSCYGCYILTLCVKVGDISNDASRSGTRGGRNGFGGGLLAKNIFNFSALAKICTCCGNYTSIYYWNERTKLSCNVSNTWHRVIDNSIYKVFRFWLYTTRKCNHFNYWSCCNDFCFIFKSCNEN